MVLDKVDALVIETDTSLKVIRNIVETEKGCFKADIIKSNGNGYDVILNSEVDPEDLKKGTVMSFDAATDRVTAFFIKIKRS